MDSLSRHHKFVSMDDWYQVDIKTIRDFGGSGLLKKYHSSVSYILENVYNDHHWQKWKFKTVPAYFDTDDQNLRDLAKYLETELSIKNMREWYRISLHVISKFVSSNIIPNCGGISSFLKRVYPSHEWEESMFESPRASQRMLFIRTQQIFPDKML
eukprot:TRINITY_DN11767_c0_g1_i1.p1 TRINITY_DN11767_c0_g1~~TRINITY_DN11767_c0_g1_i1.p1  ORF type:complete len:180 (-),score=32.27 TRINITY_DN11767_c0_g1_i1:11-478(-)